VDFTVEGRELTVDRSMLDALSDPLVHLLRNAIDHGLEPSAERVAAGKPATGQVQLRAERERDLLVLSVRDDGRGIDREVLRRRAMAEGHLPADATPLTDEALVRLLAQPGFTTADRVTALSGRGVGIDVVANRVRALGGQLAVHTVPGHGTTFTLRLPVTLAIVRALLVQVADRTYAVPTAHVVEAVDVEDVTRAPDTERDAVVIRDTTFPLVRLRALFGASGAADERPDEEAIVPTVLVLETAGRRLACVVDGLLGQQDIVVKPYVAVRGAPPLFSGATILGDGSPALIVDVGNLA
jgi:two-component system chemotaxis sensor kinase CheA